MVLATVPEAAPTARNQRATSWPAPISANEPNLDGSRLRARAFWCVSSFSVADITDSNLTIFGRCNGPIGKNSKTQCMKEKTGQAGTQKRANDRDCSVSPV